MSQNLESFVSFCEQYITGKERQESQIFLNEFFKAFGYEGALQAGATYELPIKKTDKKTGFADLVWKPRVLIEMKKRGEFLLKHYSQAFDYWTRLVPDRPRYVILCNFDEFWIFDFDIQLDEPVDIITLKELPDRASALSFMTRENHAPVFKNNQVEVTEKAGRRMGELFKILQNRLIKTPLTPLDPLTPLYKGGNTAQTPPFPRGAGGGQTLTAQRFILQCVLAMFAEDRGLLPRDLFVSCVQECLNGASSYDLIGGLFREMNILGKTPAGRYQGVDYFNGGLFSIIHPIELTKKELEFLDLAARQNWSKIRPAIFGSIFEGTANANERHSSGMHYTSEADIIKIVRPTISKYWEAKIESANTVKELSQLEVELANYKVLDPACGSGNFLYVAYQELKRIEQILLEKISENKSQILMSFVTPNQFFGLDINPFAVELAKVTLMIARKVAIDRYNLTESPLPLDSLDNNIVCQDALFSDWIKADAIIGNPPFLGGKKLRQELGTEYVDKLNQLYPDVKGQPDFCTFWFRKANDNLDDKGRAGLVGTNSIAQNVSRQASLDYIVAKGGFIYNAISTQIWSGEANVHVSIVNWSKEKPQDLFLDDLPVQTISTSLKNEISVTSAKKLTANKNLSFESCALSGKGFIISEKEALEWIKKDPKNKEVLKPMLDGQSLINLWQQKNWVIDFNDLSIEEASNYDLPFQRVKEKVKPERDNNKEKSRRENWWLHGRSRPAMRTALQGLSCYFAIPKITKYILFQAVDINILPCEANMVIASDDFYILGILNSNIHRIWAEAQSSSLGQTIRYTNTTCFETFPFPTPLTPLTKGENTDQTPPFPRGAGGVQLVEKIRETMVHLHEYRSEQMLAKQWGITQLYNQFFYEQSSKLAKLHQELDNLVMQVYGFQESDDILAKLLEMNLGL